MAITLLTQAQLRDEVKELIGVDVSVADARVSETLNRMQQRFAVSLINRYLSGDKRGAAAQAGFWITRSTITATANSENIFLPQDFMVMAELWNRNLHKPLIEVPPEKMGTWFSDKLRDPGTTVPGSITHFCVYDYAADSGTLKQRIMVRDIPDNAQVIDITYWRIPASIATSGPDFPAHWQDALIYSTASYLLQRSSPEYERLMTVYVQLLGDLGLPKV